MVLIAPEREPKLGACSAQCSSSAPSSYKPAELAAPGGHSLPAAFAFAALLQARKLSANNSMAKTAPHSAGLPNQANAGSVAARQTQAAMFNPCATTKDRVDISKSRLRVRWTCGRVGTTPLEYHAAQELANFDER